MEKQQEAEQRNEEKEYLPLPLMICRASSFRPAEKEKKTWSERLKRWLGIK